VKDDTERLGDDWVTIQLSPFTCWK